MNKASATGQQTAVLTANKRWMTPAQWGEAQLAQPPLVNDMFTGLLVKKPQETAI